MSRSLIKMSMLKLSLLKTSMLKMSILKLSLLKMSRLKMSVLNLSLVTALTCNGCASLHGRNRVLLGASVGAGIGAGGGAVLSPNDESRGLNALVFGLSGALAGSIVALLTDSEPEPKAEDKSLKAKELGATPGSREFVLPKPEGLPPFVQERLSPVVVEESLEPDTVTEDGTLRAPHKVYRIKRQAELIARPMQSGPNSQEKSQ